MCTSKPKIWPRSTVCTVGVREWVDLGWVAYNLALEAPEASTGLRLDCRGSGWPIQG